MLYITVILALLALSREPLTSAEMKDLSENQVKAAYLFNFAKYVEWPASAFSDPGAPLVIGIIGKSPFGEAIDSLAGRTAKGRKVQVRQSSRMDKLGGIQMLFIASSEKPRLREILGAVHNSSVVTVSDIKGFCDLGGMIGLMTRGEKVQFEVNIGNAERAGLKISSQMLKLAVSVRD